MLVLQGCRERFLGVQETPFEIVSISQASVLLLVLILKNDIIISMYIITVADQDTLIEQSS